MVTIYVSRKRHVWSSLSFFSPLFLVGGPHITWLYATPFGFWSGENFTKISPSSHYPKKKHDIIIIHPSIHPSVHLHPWSLLFLTIIIWQRPLQLLPYVVGTLPFLFVPISFALLWSRFVWNRSLYACLCLSVCLLSLVATRASLGVCLCGSGIWPKRVFHPVPFEGFSFLALILCALVSSVTSLSFVLCPISCALSWLGVYSSVAFFFVPELGSLLFYVLIGRRCLLLLLLGPCLPVRRLSVF